MDDLFELEHRLDVRDQIISWLSWLPSLRGYYHGKKTTTWYWYEFFDFQKLFSFFLHDNG